MRTFGARKLPLATQDVNNQPQLKSRLLLSIDTSKVGDRVFEWTESSSPNRVESMRSPEEQSKRSVDEGQPEILANLRNTSQDSELSP